MQNVFMFKKFYRKISRINIPIIFELENQSNSMGQEYLFDPSSIISTRQEKLLKGIKFYEFYKL